MDKVNITKPTHKFFETNIENDLLDLKKYIDSKYLKMKSENYKDKTIPYDPGNYWLSFNIFHFYNKGIYNIKESVKNMTKEACKYYGINFNDKKYYIHGWFNYYSEKRYLGVSPDDLNYHDHGDSKYSFHGYYCLNAEPSTTYYKIDNKRFDNVNKNNRAILSKNGYPHAIGPWDSEENRITIAYNIVPLDELSDDQDQGQFIPL
jgi:hypothetical protein